MKPIIVLISWLLFSSNTQVTSLRLTPPVKAKPKLQELDKSCNGCVKNGVLLFGNDSSYLGRKIFKNIFQGSQPKAFALCNTMSFYEFMKFLTQFETRDLLIKGVTDLMNSSRLIVFDEDYRNARLLLPSKAPEVTLSEAFFKRFQKEQSYCEKDQCTPQVVAHFKDQDGETIRLRLFSGAGSSLWRNSEDIRTKDIAPRKRKGVLYWGHVGKRVLLL